MKLRRGGQQQPSPDADTDTSADKGKASASTTDTTAGAKPAGNGQDDVFDHLDPRYKVERKLGEEGSVTNSLAMLTAIPEVDLGMECVSNIPLFPYLLSLIVQCSTRLRNIEETEKAKLSLSHGRRTREPSHRVPDEEAHLAATRCAFFFSFAEKRFS